MDNIQSSATEMGDSETKMVGMNDPSAWPIGIGFDTNSNMSSSEDNFGSPGTFVDSSLPSDGILTETGDESMEYYLQSSEFEDVDDSR